MAVDRGKLWQKIETYVLATVITALVWLYAEGENVKVHQPIPMELAFTVSSTDYYIRDPNPKMTVQVRFRCTGAEWVRQLERLDGAGRPCEIELDGNDRAIHTVSVALKQRLAEIPAIAQYAVEVESVVPENVPVILEGLVRKDLDIDVDLGLIETAIAPTVEPVQATVTMPAHIADTLGSTKLTARLDPERLAGLPEGVSKVFEAVELAVPSKLQADHVTITDSQGRPLNAVTVTLSIQSRNVRRKMPVPIYVLMPPDAVGQYAIESRPPRQVEVELRGPPEAFAQLKARAVLQFSLEELQTAAAASDGSPLPSKHATIELPPNVQAYPATPLVEYVVHKVQGQLPEGILPPDSDRTP